MKVLLKRAMFLGGVYYEPNAAGTVLPDKIGDRPVKLYDPKNPPKVRRDQRIIFEANPEGTLMTRVKDDKLVVENDPKVTETAPHILPSDVVLWSEEASHKHVPEGIPLIKGHPEIGDQIPLSAMIPGQSKAEQEAAIKKDLPKTLADRADKEEALLDAPVVGKK